MATLTSAGKEILETTVVSTVAVIGAVGTLATELDRKVKVYAERSAAYDKAYTALYVAGASELASLAFEEKYPELKVIRAKDSTPVVAQTTEESDSE